MGPRLAPRDVSARPIVTPSGGSDLAGLAQIAAVGLSAYQTKTKVDAKEALQAQEQENANFLGEYATSIGEVSLALAQGKMDSGRRGALAQVEILTQQAIRQRPELLEDISKIKKAASGVTLIDQVAKAEESVAAQKQKEKAATHAMMRRHEILPEDPDAVEKLIEITGYEHDLKRSTAQLQLLRTTESLNNEQFETHAKGSFDKLFLINSSSWIEIAKQAQSVEGNERADATTMARQRLDEDLISMEQQLVDMYPELEDTAITKIMRTAKLEVDKLKVALDDEALLKAYENRNKLNKEMGVASIIRTPQDAARKEIVDQVLRMPDLVDWLVSNPKAGKEVTNWFPKMWGAISSGKGLHEMDVDKTTINDFTVGFLGQLSNAGTSIPKEDYSLLAKNLASTWAGAARDPSAYSHETWDALMAFAADSNNSEWFKQEAVQVEYKKGSAAYAANLIASARTNAEENGLALVVEDGAIKAQYSPSETKSDDRSSQVGHLFPSKSESGVEAAKEFNSRYGTKLNNLVSAETVVAGRDALEVVNDVVARIGSSGGRRLSQKQAGTPLGQEIMDEFIKEMSDFFKEGK